MDGRKTGASAPEQLSPRAGRGLLAGLPMEFQISVLDRS